MSSIEEIWNDAKVSIKKQLNEESFQRWIAVIIPVGYSKGVFELGVENGFVSQWIEEYYQEAIEKSLSDLLTVPIKIKFSEGYSSEVKYTPTQKAEKPVEVKSKNSEDKTSKKNDDSEDKLFPGYNPRFVFKKFVTGDSNRFCQAACHAVASTPGRVYNPLFIYGNTGLGKTHLMQSIAQTVLNNRKRARVEYLSSEEFLNNFVDAVQNNTLKSFRRHYRSLDLLLIDDVQFFKGKERMQEEFFHTFNYLFNAHKQVVLTSDRPPHEIDGLEKRLVSRFECGQIVDVTMPCFETRVAILRKKQEEQNVKLDDDVLFFVADRVRSNVRRLEGALIRLTSYVSMMRQQMDIPTAEKLLGSMLEEDAMRKITIRGIQEHVAQYYDIRVSDIVGSKRPANIALPRQVAMYLSRDLTNESLPSIGGDFNRNHATILHAVNAIRKRVEADDSFKNVVNALSRQLKSV